MCYPHAGVLRWSWLWPPPPSGAPQSSGERSAQEYADSAYYHQPSEMAHFCVNNLNNIYLFANHYKLILMFLAKIIVFV